MNGIITAGVVLNVHMKIARGPPWQWEVQWANINEEGQSVFIWPKPNFYGNLVGPILRLNINTQSSLPTKNYNPTPHIYLTLPRSPSHKSPISPYLEPPLLHSHQLLIHKPNPSSPITSHTPILPNLSQYQHQKQNHKLKFIITKAATSNQPTKHFINESEFSKDGM